MKNENEKIDPEKVKKVVCFIIVILSALLCALGESQINVMSNLLNVF